MKRCLGLLAAMLLLMPALSIADPINIGILSFDPIFDADGNNSGVNVFNIANLTGDPALGGFALPPDFPAFDPLIFLDSSLTLTTDGTTNVISLGNIGPGFFGPTFPVEFPDTTLFSSALFEATLNQTSFLLSDGTLFTASPTISTLLLPSLGSTLTPGADLAVLTVSEATPNVAPVPEPSTLLLSVTGLTALIAIKIRSRRNSRPCSSGL